MERHTNTKGKENREEIRFGAATVRQNTTAQSTLDTAPKGAICEVEHL